VSLDFRSICEQVGSLEEAAKAKEACVDGIIVQGREAGGHVIGQVNKYSLVVLVSALSQCWWEIFQETHILSTYAAIYAYRIFTMLQISFLSNAEQHFSATMHISVNVLYARLQSAWDPVWFHL